jgi:hypothetical protein
MARVEPRCRLLFYIRNMILSPHSNACILMIWFEHQEENKSKMSASPLINYAINDGGDP